MNENELTLEDEIYFDMIINDLSSQPEYKLVEASREGDVAEVRRLIENGIAPTARLHVDSPFSAAAKSSHIQVIELLLEFGLRDSNENLLITTATCCDSPAVIEFLVKKGYEPDLPDERGWTVLHHAVRHGHTESARWLVENCFLDINRPDLHGRTPLMLSSLLPNDSSMLSYLLTVTGLNVNAQDKQAWTALMRCVRYGFLENASKLLHAGANPNLQDSSGHTGLMMAAEAESADEDRIVRIDGGLVRVRRDRFPEIVELLLDHGADPHIKDNEGGSALNFALFEGNSESAEAIWRVQDESQEPFAPERLTIEEINLPVGKVILAKFYDRRLFETSLLRASEFTESDVFKNRIFSLHEYRSWFNSQNSSRYCDLVYGINLSSDSLETFHQTYGEQLSNEEVAFRERLPNGRFYLIGINIPACGAENYDMTLKHEVSHALFFLDAEYRQVAELAWASISPDEKETVLRFFEEHDYTEAVWADEFCAHEIEGWFERITIQQTEAIRALKIRYRTMI